MENFRIKSLINSKSFKEMNWISPFRKERRRQKYTTFSQPTS